MKKLFFALPLVLAGIIAEAQPTVITGTQSVTPSSYNQDGYIIKGGSQLNLGPGTYMFNPGYGIDVLTNGYLHMNGSVTNLECNSSSANDYWKGITIYGSPVSYSTSNSIEENWGFKTDGDFNILKAETGVSMIYQLGDYNGVNGQIEIVGDGYARSIQSNNQATCKFVNDQYYDIRIVNQDVSENHSSSANGYEWLNYEMTSNSSDFIISMELVNTNLMSHMIDFKINSPEQGIYLSNSNAHLIQCEVFAHNPNMSGIVHRISNNHIPKTVIEDCKIEAPKYVVYSRGSKDVTIKTSFLHSNGGGHCVYLENTHNAIVHLNKLGFADYGIEAFECTETKIDGNITHHNSISDVKIRNCYDTWLTRNRVGDSSPIFSSSGIEISGSDYTRIVKNNFYESEKPLYFHGGNFIAKIHCNTFHQSTIAPMMAALVIDGNPFLGNQGNPTDGGANNDFSLLDPGTLRVLNNTGGLLNFTNTQGIPFGNNFPSVGASFNTDPNYNANCNVTKLAQDDTELIVEVSPTPNPFTDALTIGENITEVQLFNIGGQRVETLKPQSNEINLGHLDSGVYFMVTRDVNGKQNRHKIVKQ